MYCSWDHNKLDGDNMRQFLISALIALIATTAPDVRGADAPASTDSNVEKREVRGESVQSERDEQEALFHYYFRQRTLKYETRLKEL